MPHWLEANSAPLSTLPVHVQDPVHHADSRLHLYDPRDGHDLLQRGGGYVHPAQLLADESLKTCRFPPDDRHEAGMVSRLTPAGCRHAASPAEKRYPFTVHDDQPSVAFGPDVP